jgi:hypothetical protein
VRIGRNPLFSIIAGMERAGENIIDLTFIVRSEIVLVGHDIVLINVHDVLSDYVISIS